MQNQIICGNCYDSIEKIPDDSVNLVFTSPPYAEQRKNLYAGIKEEEYPKWFSSFMLKLKEKVKQDASVFIVIRPHIRDGVVSDYVLRTQLAIREVGWKECEELIWYKPDGPPLGHNQRPRRSWEKVLWFSLSNKPYINLRACASVSDKVGLAGSSRFGKRLLHTTKSKKMRRDKSRISDVFIAKVGEISRKIMHPAMFPRTLAAQFIKTFSKPGDMVLDPFCGSGTTLLEAHRLERKYLGIDVSSEYCEMARNRLKIVKKTDIFDDQTAYFTS